MQPIGRRSLSRKHGITERVLRTETDLLKKSEFDHDTSKSGMTLTTRGEEVYQSLENFMDPTFRYASNRTTVGRDILVISAVSLFPETAKEQTKWLMHSAKR